jgi:hypothetical protein
MVLTESHSSAILVEPMKNRSSSEMIRAYQALIGHLNAAGIFPNEHILDNECSTGFKSIIKTNKMTYQLVPPHDHRRNWAEKAIQTFNTHFISSYVERTRAFHFTSGTDSSSKLSTHSTYCDQPGLPTFGVSTTQQPNFCTSRMQSQGSRSPRDQRNTGSPHGNWLLHRQLQQALLLPHHLHRQHEEYTHLQLCIF